MKKILKNSILIMLCSIFVVLFSACTNTAKYSLSVDENIKSGVELVIGEDPKTFIFTIKNFDDKFSTKFNYSFYDNIAKIDKYEHIGEGKIQVTISGLVGGKTTLKITSYQGGLSIDIPVIVTEKIQTINLKEGLNPFLVKGESLTFDGDTLLNFNPEYTKQKEVEFHYIASNDLKLKIDNNLISANGNKLLFTSNGTEQSFDIDFTKFKVMALSTYDALINCTFDVNLVNKIETTDVSLIQKELGENIDIIINGEKINTIPKLIRNNKTYSKYNFSLNINQTNNTIQIYSKFNKFLPEITSVLEENNTTKIDFSIQPVLTGVDQIVIKISDKTVSDYYQEFFVEVEAIEIPSGLLLNDIPTGLEVLLFSGQSINNSTTVKYTTYPTESYNNNPVLYLQFYKDINKTEVLENANELLGVSQNRVEINNFVDLIISENNNIVAEIDQNKNFKIKDKTFSLDNFNLEENEFEQKFKVIKSLKINTLNQDGALSFWSKSQEEENYYINFMCLTNIDNFESFTTENILKVSVKKSATDFYVDNKYLNGEIYVEQNLNSNIFKGLIIEPKTAFVGEMMFTPLTENTTNIAEIAQIEKENVLTLELLIKGKQTGKAKYLITLQNGFKTTLTINVVKLYESEQDLSFTLAEANPNVAKVSYDVNGNISDLVVRKNQEKIYFSTIINASDEAYKFVDIRDEEINWQYVLAYETFEKRVGKIEFYTFKLDDFKLVINQEIQKHEFNVQCFEALNSLILQTENPIVYEMSSLGYFEVQQKLHQSKLDFKGIDDKKLEEILPKLKWSFSKSYMSNTIHTDISGSNINISDYGTFNTQDLTFSYSTTATNISNELYIYVDYVEYDKNYSSFIKLDLRNFIKASEITLKNYVSKVNLDIVNNTKTLYLNISPNNATDKRFVYSYELLSGSYSVNFQIAEDYSFIKLDYNGTGGCKGILKLIPISQFTSEQEYTHSLDIEIEVQDGTREYPILLKDAQDFISAFSTTMGLLKHYQIQEEIDFTGYNISTFGELKGSIVGTTNRAKLTNLKINNPKQNFAGIFSSVAKLEIENVLTPSLENIRIEGCYDLKNIKNVNVGFVCGLNEGLIKNVSLTLLQSSVNIQTTDNDIFLGGLCAENKGKIIFEVYSDTNETTIINIPEGQTLEVLETTARNSKLFIGGIVGKNSGEITFARKDNKTLIANKFGYSAYVNINTNSNAAGIVGVNSGIISGHLVGGKIAFYNENTNIESYKSGIAVENEGENSKIFNNTTRVFVRNNSYVSGLVSRALNGNIENNNVEATYISSASEIEIPLLIFKKQTTQQSNDTYLSALYNEKDVVVISQNNNVVSFHNWYDVMFLDATNNYKNQAGVIYTNSEFNSSSNKFNKIEINDNLSLVEANAYLSYYSAKDKNLIFTTDSGTTYTHQDYLDKFNNIHTIIPFEVDSANITLKNNLILESKNTNVVSILENGNFKINSVGSADIVIKSSLNHDYYVVAKLYVSYKVNGYKLYYSSEKTLDTELLNNSLIKFYTNQTFSLYSELFAEDILTFGNTKITLTEPTTKDVVLNLKVVDESDFVEITSNNGHHVFKGKNQGLSTIFGEIIYSSGNYRKIVYSDYKNSDYDYKFNVNYIKGASKLNINQNKISVFPSHDINVLVTAESDDSDEYVELEIYSDGNKVNYLFDVEIIKNSFSFEYKVNLLTENYDKSGIYTFKFIAKNGLSKVLDVEILPQPITNITVNTYSKYEVDENIQDTEITDFVEPANVNNYMTIFIDPGYADYDYLEIINDNSNYTSNSQALFSYVSNNGNMSNFAYTNNGIKIFKNNSSNLYTLRYVIGSNAVDGSSTIIYINAYKNNIIIYPVKKTLKVRALADVTVTLSGKNSKLPNYVAKGTNVSIDINLGKYDLSQVVFESSDKNVVIHPIENLIEIKKSATSDKVVNIISYGTYKFNGNLIKGRKSVLELNIVDFALPKDNFATKSKTLSTTLSSVLEVNKQMFEDVDLIYNPSLTAVQTSVNNFKNKLITTSKYQLKVYDDTNKKSEIIILDTSKTYIYDEFKLQFNNDVWKLTPYKTLQSGKYSIIANIELSFTNKIDVVENNGVEYTIQKDLEILSNSSKETPLPIRTIDQLYSMQDGQYYILLEDLDFTNSQTKFKPITAKVAGFNGNNHKIIISSMEISELTGNEVQTIQSVANIGLFESVEENTVIQNINIYIPVVATFNISKYTTTTTYIGLIAGENKGIITNCYVCSKDGAQISTNVVEVGVTGSAVYMAGLVGKNDGYITNSRFECNLISNSHLSGLVGINNKHISACFVNNSELINSSSNINTTNKTSGFVIENNGNIFESYITGGYNTNKDLYSKVKYISGKQETASFVYLNNNKIKNCYADITTYGQGETSGFIFNNIGSVENCYSTCKLKDNSQSSYAFVKSGDDILNCYFANDLNNGIYNYRDNYNEKLFGIKLNDFMEKFETSYCKINDFVIANSDSKNKRDYIWFFANDGFETEFNKQQNLSFNVNKPQLSSPNVIISSNYIFTEITYDKTTGQEIYNYIDEENVYGSKFNPIIIDSAFAMESEFILNSTLQNNKYVNNKYFRLVQDIDYEKEKITSSKLYNSTFIGQFEGNNLSISNYSINTNANLVSSGYFGEIGNGTTKGSVKNLNLTPKYINIPNAIIVGSLAGTVNYGNIVEINVNASNITINAKNIAGGVIGRAINSFNLININSNVSANATNYTNDFSTAILYNAITDKYNTVSYAGGVAGLISGEFGYVKNINITGEIAVIGKIAGLAFGGILDEAKVDGINVSVSSRDMVKAYAYGGLVVGHLKGQLHNVNLLQTEIGLKDIFAVEPIVPIAIGGVVGIYENYNSTDIKNIYNINVDFELISSKCYTVGGLVGFVIYNDVDFNTTFENINIKGKVQGPNCVGGLIGRITTYQDNMEYSTLSTQITTENRNLMINNVNLEVDIVCDNSVTYNNYLEKFIYIGGVIGLNSTQINLSLTNLNYNNDISTNIKAISEKVHIYYSNRTGWGNIPGTSDLDLSIIIKRIGVYENLAGINFIVQNI